MCLAIFVPITIIFLMGLQVTHALPYEMYSPAPDKWPAECKGISYCDIKPSYYPNAEIEKLMNNVNMSLEINTKNDVRDRHGDDFDDEDVANCKPDRSMLKIFLIKDGSGRIRYVPQTKNFAIKILTITCKNPGRVTKAYDLDNSLFTDHRVDCVEKRVPFMFPVLSLDGTKLDSVAPRGGVSLSCSAKIMWNPNVH